MLHIMLVGLIIFGLGLVWGAGILLLIQERRRKTEPGTQGHGAPGPGLRPSAWCRLWPARDTQVGGNHYCSKAIQPWDAMEAWMTPEQFRGFLRGNAIKYLARCDDKGGMEDIRKADHYLNKLLEVK
jgi:hypothetical protein